jgi:hypothetical protein
MVEYIYRIGILAYGSLIDYPGIEISEIEIDRIVCETPFKVEYARSSSTRCGAPTLIPVDEGGKKVKATIIVLNPETNIKNAESILYRRELHKTNRHESYTHSDNPSVNKVIIKSLTNFNGVENVLYTSIGCNIQQTLTGELLADLSIKSINLQAGIDEKDGLRYLLSAKRNGIVTGLSDEYEKHILLKTETENLEQAIEKLDRKRQMYFA